MVMNKEKRNSELGKLATYVHPKGYLDEIQRQDVLYQTIRFYRYVEAAID